jgi:3-oxoadipate enol-lactonase
VLQAPDMAGTAAMFLRNWFPAAMLEKDTDSVREFRRTLLATRREGTAGSWGAIRDADLRRTIALISRPTLVIAGANDTVTSVRHAQEIAATIPSAQLRVLEAVHLSNVEKPTEFLDAVLTFLT